MASEDSISEDYVAELLKKDAKESSRKYSALGVGALLPQRPTTRAPKPNTRFLKNLIRDTDNHNAALKAKELEDAAARLGLRPDRVSGDSHRPRHSDQEHRSKRRRLDESEEENMKRKGKETSRRRSTSRNDRDHGRGPTGHRKSRHHRRSSPSESEEHKHRRHYRRHHRDDENRHRGRSQSPWERERHNRDRGKFRSQERASSPRVHKPAERAKRDHGPDFDLAKAFDKARRRRSHRSRSRSRSPYERTSARRGSRSRLTADVPRLSTTAPVVNDNKGHKKSRTELLIDSGSDPLESIIGPQPPPSPPRVKRRGRGVLSGSAGIDSRFSASYDPTTDVHPNSGSEDDWDQALEALRDRQKWKQQGADRLRAAGFTEDEVASWEKGGKNEEDVRWKGRGEGREWDRGKVVDEDGAIQLAPEFGRLKGT